LLNTLDDLLCQDHQDWECIIVSQGDNWQTLAPALHMKMPENLRFFHLKEPNASLARNIGLREAKGEIALFLDDDVVIKRRDFLANHARHFKDPKVSGVAGQVVGPDEQTRTERHRMSNCKRNGWLYFPPNFTGQSYVRNGASNNLSVRRKEAIESGGMDAHFVKGAHREESDFCLRYTDAYGLMVFDPEASLIHLGERVGGCRNWGMNEGVHPLHHVAGEWYFILRGVEAGSISIMDLAHHGFALLRRQIMNRPNLRSPQQLLRAIRRSGEGFRVGWGQFRTAPRRITSLQPGDYQEV
jgi:glycosyltransferase involved in cell wall biosynthesis